MMSASLSAAAETIDDRTPLSIEQSVEDTVLLSTAYSVADSFVRDYYTAIYDKGDRDFLSSIKSDNLLDYLTTKIEWLSSTSVDKENIIISTELVEQEIIQSTIKLCLDVKLSFNYVGNTTESGFERCVQIVLSNNNEPQILDVIINDNVDDFFRDEANIMSATYDHSYWSDDTSSLTVVSDILNVAEAEIANTYAMEGGFSQLAQSTESDIELTASTSSKITETQRNNIVKYALANCNVKSPASGNSALISDYFDLSQFDGNYDCTNFTSHCLLAGGAKFNETKGTGWYYKSLSDRTTSWASVSFFYNFISTNTGDGPQAEINSLSVYCPMNQMTCDLGDIIQIDIGEDGIYDHNVVVTGFYNYNSYSNNAMVSGRSGSDSGLQKWYVKNEVYVEAYPISQNDPRVIHFTTLG